MFLFFCGLKIITAFSLDLETFLNSIVVKQQLLRCGTGSALSFKKPSRHIPHEKQLLDFCIYSWIQYKLSLGFVHSSLRCCSELCAPFWRRSSAPAATRGQRPMTGYLLAPPFIGWLFFTRAPDLSGWGSAPFSRPCPPWWGFRWERRHESASCSPGLQLWCVAAGPPDPETGNGDNGGATRWPK